MAWVFINSASSSNTITAFDESSVPQFLINTSGQINLIDMNQLQIGNGDTDIGTSTWAHVTVTHTTTPNPDETEFFLNGVTDGTATVNSSFGYAGVTVMHFGSNFPGASRNEMMDGIISEYAEWDVVLTDAQILLAGTSKGKRIPLQIDPTNLIAYYPLDDQPDGTSNDGNVFRSFGTGGNICTGDDGAGNTGVIAKAEEVITYP